MREAILEHARKIDDRIQLARKNLNHGPNTTVTETVEHLLKMATEAYFDLNEAVMKLPDGREEVALKPSDDANRIGKGDDRRAYLEGLAHDTKITVPRIDSLLNIAREKLMGGFHRDGINLIGSAQSELSDLYPSLRLLEGGEEA